MSDNKNTTNETAPISRDAVFDPETVILQATYRIGFLPPLKGSLALGEIFIELGEGAPRFWVGTRAEGNNPGNMAVISGPAGEPRDPPKPAEPADALPTPQQHLPAQYQQEGSPQSQPPGSPQPQPPPEPPKEPEPEPEPRREPPSHRTRR